MDLKRYRHLIALADEGNFARAAVRVNLSQPALSRSIQAAEAELDICLFDRGTIEVTPTPAGEFVLERARRLLFDSRCIERDINLYCQRLIGDLSFGVGPFPAATLLPVLMPEIRKTNPDVQLSLEVNNSINLLERLRDEALDFFVADTSDLPTGTDLDIIALSKQFGGLYVRSNHPLLNLKTVHLKDVIKFGLATVRLPPSVRNALASFITTTADAALPLALECDDVLILKQTALSSDTVLAMVHAAVVDEVEDGRLFRLSIPSAPKLHSEMGIVSLRGRSHSPLAQHVIERIVAISEQIASNIDDRFEHSTVRGRKTQKEQNSRSKKQTKK
jgi:DNA-binding transcriptional LysR family regulator